MSSTTEMTSPQAAHRRMGVDLNDQTGAGDESSGADAGMWTETDHGKETGNRKSIEGDEKGTGAEKEMMAITDIRDRVGREIRAGTDVRKMKIEEGERITAVMMAVKVEERTNICRKGKSCNSACDLIRS